MVTPTGAAGLDPVPRKHQGLGLGQLAVTGAARGGIPRGEGGGRRPRGHVPPRNWAARASAGTCGTWMEVKLFLSFACELKVTTVTAFSDSRGE